jgi:serine/threonine protein kinase
MEAYTLYWKGQILREMLDYNTKYSPIIDNCTSLRQSKLDMEGQTQLVTFKQNCVKLAWAFIDIMNAVHHCKILHNDLSKDNIMLHFLIDKPDVVYIKVCDWGVAKHLQEVMPSLYGFAKE